MKDDAISRQAAIDEITEYGSGDTIYMSVGELRRRIECIPSAQPEIIHCKDCRYYQDNNGGYPHMDCKWTASETPDADDFCSGAERRTDG